jgi:hypothetical protein
MDRKPEDREQMPEEIARLTERDTLDRPGGSLGPTARIAVPRGWLRRQRARLRG